MSTVLLLIIIIIVSLMHCVLSKVLKAWGQPLTSQQMVSVRLEWPMRIVRRRELLKYLPKPQMELPLPWGPHQATFASLSKLLLTRVSLYVVSSPQTTNQLWDISSQTRLALSGPSQSGIFFLSLAWSLYFTLWKLVASCPILWFSGRRLSASRSAGVFCVT